MRAWAYTDRGGVRERNEDALLWGGVVSRTAMGGPEEMADSGDAFMGAVADGMGGGPGGAEAARAVLRNLSSAVLPAFWEEAREIVSRRLADTSLELARSAREDPSLAGMGTAVAGLWARGDRALAFNCGDCRVYRIRHGYFDLITKDHSIVYELYSSGAITEEEMATHHLKHILTSSVQDSPDPPRAFFREIPLQKGDAFLVCSDGVWEALPRSEMERMAGEVPPGEASARMASALQGLGCRDNTTFLWIG
ncbi:MAG: protein phosphatase 2C domain-containing protein [Deltaproteobacteria bacterium]|nr:protein phosphatase 2C domain-containing protein [Deltaproteobacteria bacterium]